jgi:hypothetical protein
MTTALAAFAEHVWRRESGEFIATDARGEVHLFLQGGRLAWGTTSASKLVFRATLLELTGLETARLQAEFEACLRARLPLGETLVKHGVATLAQVQQALRAQLQATLTDLVRIPAARSLFLTRDGAFGAYEPRLTFAFEDFKDFELLARRNQAEAPLARVRELSQWCAVSHGERVLASFGKNVLRPTVFQSLLRADTLMASVRSPSMTMAGVRLPGAPGMALWCGAVGRSLAPALQVMDDYLPEATGPAQAPVAPREFGDTHSAPAARVRAMLETLEVPVSVIVIGRPESTWAQSNRPDDLLETTRAAVKHQRLVDRDLHITHGAPSDRAAPRQSVMLGEATQWWFGVDVGGPAPVTVWVTTPRATARAEGWAVCERLTRAVLDEPTAT